MSQEKLKSKLDQAKGGAKEGFGKITGDKELEAKLADDAKDAVEGAVDAVKEKLK